jgi:hypothetical protein
MVIKCSGNGETISEEVNDVSSAPTQQEDVVPTYTPNRPCFDNLIFERQTMINMYNNSATIIELRNYAKGIAQYDPCAYCNEGCTQEEINYHSEITNFYYNSYLKHARGNNALQDAQQALESARGY